MSKEETEILKPLVKELSKINNFITFSNRKERLSAGFSYPYILCKFFMFDTSKPDEIKILLNSNNDSFLIYFQDKSINLKNESDIKKSAIEINETITNEILSKIQEAENQILILKKLIFQSQNDEENLADSYIAITGTGEFTSSPVDFRSYIKTFSDNIDNYEIAYSLYVRAGKDRELLREIIKTKNLNLEIKKLSFERLKNSNWLNDTEKLLFLMPLVKFAKVDELNTEECTFRLSSKVSLKGLKKIKNLDLGTSDIDISKSVPDLEYAENILIDFYTGRLFNEKAVEDLWKINFNSVKFIGFERDNKNVYFLSFCKRAIKEGKMKDCNQEHLEYIKQNIQKEGI